VLDALGARDGAGSGLAHLEVMSDALPSTLVPANASSAPSMAASTRYLDSRTSPGATLVVNELRARQLSEPAPLSENL